MTSRFERYAKTKTEQALAARLPGFETVVEQVATRPELVQIGSAWTRRLFDGWFYRSAYEAERRQPVVSLVFVQSADGNTEADDPSTLGGGDTDKHLVYEGLSRIDADAVLAGANTAGGGEFVFSVWHPELVQLRLARGQPRHPAQVVVTQRGRLPIEDALLYNEPSLRVIVIGTRSVAASLGQRVHNRPWIEVIDTGETVDIRRGLGELQGRGITVVSAIGGRQTARALIRAGAVSDLYLTTSPVQAGIPDTPLVSGRLPAHRVLMEKKGRDSERGVRFQHAVFDRAR